MVMASEWDGTAWAGSEPVEARTEVEGSLAYFINRLHSPLSANYRLPSIREALGVPAFARSVTLIANTTGALTVQAFRNAAVMGATPALVARPNPHRTPRAFYRDTAYNMATRGEFVWFIAKRDSDGYAAALVVVPLNELTVEENPGNRLFPIYRWGDVESTRYSPANPSGRFVHETYLEEPGDLRGLGPLQLCRAATSVAVEAQDWAANFYADGGHPSVIIKSAVELSPTKLDPDTWEPDADGYNEAELMRRQWTDRPNNVPRVIDPKIESVDYMQPSEVGAQMLQSRDYQNGEAARVYGIPGALLEYGVPGSSLTYQNIADVWTSFLKGCLAINYLEPIEQTLSDLLPRSQAARFRIDGFFRADLKTRWEVYQIAAAVLGQEAAAQMASEAEGIIPGNVEVAPVPFSPPASIPTTLPEVRSEPDRVEVRCDGMRVMRGNYVTCGKLLSETGAFVGRCPRCKKAHGSAAA